MEIEDDNDDNLAAAKLKTTAPSAAESGDKKELFKLRAVIDTKSLYNILSDLPRDQIYKIPCIKHKAYNSLSSNSNKIKTGKKRRMKWSGVATNKSKKQNQNKKRDAASVLKAVGMNDDSCRHPRLMNFLKQEHHVVVTRFRLRSMLSFMSNHPTKFPLLKFPDSQHLMVVSSSYDVIENSGDDSSIVIKPQESNNDNNDDESKVKAVEAAPVSSFAPNPVYQKMKELLSFNTYYSFSPKQHPNLLDALYPEIKNKKERQRLQYNISHFLRDMDPTSYPLVFMYPGIYRKTTWILLKSDIHVKVVGRPKVQLEDQQRVVELGLTSESVSHIPSSTPENRCLILSKQKRLSTRMKAVKKGGNSGGSSSKGTLRKKTLKKKNAIKTKKSTRLIPKKSTQKVSKKPASTDNTMGVDDDSNDNSSLLLSSIMNSLHLDNDNQIIVKNHDDTDENNTLEEVTITTSKDSTVITNNNTSEIKKANDEKEIQLKSSEPIDKLLENFHL